MNYESEADYNAAMCGHAESEMQYFAEQEKQYNDYLDGLIESKQYQVFGIEICLDYLNSKEFEKSGLSEKQFLTYKKKLFLHPKKEDSETENQTLYF